MLTAALQVYLMGALPNLLFQRKGLLLNALLRCWGFLRYYRCA